MLCNVFCRHEGKLQKTSGITRLFGVEDIGEKWGTLGELGAQSYSGGAQSYSMKDKAALGPFPVELEEKETFIVQMIKWVPAALPSYSGRDFDQFH